MRGVSAPPPCHSPERLLALVVVALSFIVGASRVAADEVRLLSQVNTRTEMIKTVGTNHGGLFVRTSDQYSGYNYQRGATYTNYSITIQKDDNKAAQVPGVGISLSLSTNLSSVPWVGDALAYPGTTLSISLTTNSQWSFDYVTENFVWVENCLPGGSTNTYTNFAATLEGPAWPMKEVKYSITTESGGTESDDHTVTTTVELVTDGPANQSALFRLSSVVTDLGEIDPQTGSPRVLWSGWTLGGDQPDMYGVIYKVLANNTTNDVSVALCDLSGIVTNWTYDHPAAVRVDLALQWRKSTSTNDADWQSTTLYVLKGTTVSFRVISPNVTNVTWPTGLPTWSGGGSSGTGPTFDITFNTLSADTNGSWVVATAGSSVSNRVVAYDFGVVARGADPLFNPAPRTNFGVGELISFALDYKPESLSNTPPSSFIWHGVGGGSYTGYSDDDRSLFTDGNPPYLQAGALGEGWAVNAAIISGVNAGVTRSMNLTILAPTNAILVAVTTNVAHTSNVISAAKLGWYQIQPTVVDFSGIKFREGSNVFSWQWETGQSTNVLGSYWSGEAWVTPAENQPIPFKPIEPHAIQNWQSIGHLISTNGSIKNCSNHPDQFATTGDALFFRIPAPGFPNGLTWSPNTTHTNICEIPLSYTFVDRVIPFCSVPTTRVLGPQGFISIKKDGLGPFPKPFSSPTTPLH